MLALKQLGQHCGSQHEHTEPSSSRFVLQLAHFLRLRLVLALWSFLKGPYQEKSRTHPRLEIRVSCSSFQFCQAETFSGRG